MSNRRLFTARIFCGWVLVCGLLGGSAFAGPPVTVVDVQGQTHTGTLTDWTAQEITLTGDNQPKTIPLTDVLRLQFNHPRLKSHLSGAVLFLANGDRLVAQPESIDDTFALARWQVFPSWKSVKVPLETISSLILDLPEIAALRSEALRTALDRRQKNDLVDLKNGDQVSGEFLGLTEKTLKLQTAVGETSIERDSLRLMTMNRELISFPEVKGLTLLLSLIDGSRLTITDLKLQPEDRILVQAAFGGELDLPLSAVESVRPLGGRAVYLSDLKPASYEHKPYLAGRWDWKADRNVLGEPLQLDGREYAKGVGLHSQSVIAYDLNGQYQTFRAIIGVDDAADHKGSVVFAVEVDGREVFRSDPQSARHKGVELPPVSVQGAKRLTLKADFGEFGDVLDYANWCEAVLILP